MKGDAVPACPDRETELLAAVARGDCAAFEELYLGYQHRLARFLFRLAPRHQIADEVINDTFLVVWRKAKYFRGDSLVSTWIMGIAYRRALRMLRQARADLPSAGGQPRMTERYAAEPGKEFEQREWLTRGLHQLPSEQRASLELAYQLGYSCKEIAQIMDCGIPAVKSRMSRGRDNLRISLPLLAGHTERAREPISNFLTAAFAGLAIGLLIWHAASWTHSSGTSREGVYRTVTSTERVHEDTTVRVVFSPSLTPTERDVLLESADLYIISGPTAAGVYSLAPVAGADHRGIDAALLQLRSHRSVIFAEPVAHNRQR